MRLKPKEVESILRVFKSHHDDEETEIYLFGSRTDDSKKGGDIDLLVVANAFVCEKLKVIKFKISDDIQKQIGEQKIDITFATKDSLAKDEFLKSIFPGALKLDL
jgi:predicted nucleotidyltransferase